MAVTLENRALYAIQYGAGDIWMNDRGNLGSRTLCQVFEAADDAAAFLASRQLRPGFRRSMAIKPLTVAELRAMVDAAGDCLDAATRHGGNTGLWTNRIELLLSFLPLEVN